MIATKHSKEDVIAPVLEKALHVKCMVPKGLDTDQFGTFTGEINRTGSPVDTARKKCMLAMELSGCDIAVASEGSFGPHPSFFFIPANDEVMLFIDRKNGIEIVERELSTDTNFCGREVTTIPELKEFARLAKFPTHGLIIRKSEHEYSDITKGISSWGKLLSCFDVLFKKYGCAYVQTDMRAMFNPTRMNVIERVALRLARRITSQCPECNYPGFGIVEALPGLPCSFCGTPTKSTIVHLYRCQKCGFTREEKYPGHVFTEEPRYCDVWNRQKD